MPDNDEAEGAGKRKMVPVRVNPSIHSAWHEYVENNEEWDSVSDLIRGAVSREMAGHYQHSPDAPTIQGNVDVDLDPIKDQLNGIERNIDKLTDKVGSLISVEQQEINNLSLDVRDMIPMVDDPDTIKNLGSPDTVIPLEERVKTYGAINDIVTYFKEADGVREDRVRRAIDRLRTDLPATIHTVEVVHQDKSKEVRICEVR